MKRTQIARDRDAILAFHRPMWNRLRGNAGDGIEKAVPGFLASVQSLFDQGYSLTDVGLMFGVTRERIRQLAIRHGLTPFVTSSPARIWSWEQSCFIALPIAKFKYARQQKRERHQCVRRERTSSRQQRFWESVAIGHDDQCWEWNGLRTKWRAPYGLFYEPAVRRGATFAHRISFLYSYGWIPIGKHAGSQIIAHTCDNGLCVNPSHLVPMTHSENILDSVRKGRWARSHAESWRRSRKAKAS